MKNEPKTGRFHGATSLLLEYSVFNAAEVFLHQFIQPLFSLLFLFMLIRQWISTFLQMFHKEKQRIKENKSPSFYSRST